MFYTFWNMVIKQLGANCSLGLMGRWLNPHMTASSIGNTAMKRVGVTFSPTRIEFWMGSYLDFHP